MNNDSNFEKIMTAIEDNNEGLVLRILNEDPSVTVQARSNGTTALMTACSLKLYNTIEHLVEAGAAIGPTDKNGNTALHYLFMPPSSELSARTKKDALLVISSSSTRWFAISRSYYRLKEARLGEHINVANANQETALELAVKYITHYGKRDTEEILSKMIQDGANPLLLTKEENLTIAEIILRDRPGIDTIGFYEHLENLLLEQKTLQSKRKTKPSTRL